MFKKIDQVDFLDNKYLITYLCTYYAYSRKVDIYEASEIVDKDKQLRKNLYEEVIKFFAGEDIVIENTCEDELGEQFSIPIIYFFGHDKYNPIPYVG